MTTLFKKLNYKNHKTILVLNAPTSFENEMEQMKNDANVVVNIAQLHSTDFAIVFALKQADINNSIKALHKKLEGDYILWYCYPKGSSKKYKCDFNRDTGWQALGAYQLEPVRQVAIDEDWSALRFRNVNFIKTMSRGFAISEQGKNKVNNN